MSARLKTGLHYALLLLGLLGGTFGAGILSVYASGVASTLSAATLGKAAQFPQRENSLVQVRKNNLLEEFSGKTQTYALVRQDFAGTTAFLYMISDKSGSLVKSVVIKKIGISVFAPYIVDSAFNAGADTSQNGQNPILNALNVRAKALRLRIEAAAAQDGRGKP